MFDAYKKRMQLPKQYTTGIDPAKEMRATHDFKINDSFIFDIAYKQCLINGVTVDAKFQVGSTTDVDDDKPYYRLQFRPEDDFDIGTIVDIPEDKYTASDYQWWEDHEPDYPEYRGCYIAEDGTHYRRWMIVDTSKDAQEQRYYIEECDWCLNWIYVYPKDNKRYLCKHLGAMRIRNSYSSGIYEKYYLTRVESQDAIWLPTNKITKTLTYDQRFLISDNEYYPQAYKLSGMYTNHPVGLTKLILTQMETDTEDDYYKSERFFDTFELPLIANGASGYDGLFNDIIKQEDNNTDDADALDYAFTVTNDSEDIIYTKEKYAATFIPHFTINDVEQDIALGVDSNHNSTIDWNVSLIRDDDNESLDDKLHYEVLDDKSCRVWCDDCHALLTEQVHVECTFKYTTYTETLEQVIKEFVISQDLDIAYMR